ncbi:xanthine dehydrogenase accessory protein XdhC [Niveibacterium sp. SC-1]|uniref:xanthine dehydrogenase accessory protein XdhC n=1 Tax=Niveibacterium sp. SC-1 TaxID=3135646 RepID=UPI00311FB027
MSAWLDTLPTWLAQEPNLLLVTVAATEGSVPREPGAAMLVGRERLEGTIGGGHLEWEATAIARALQKEGPRARLVRFALGPSLGQCCGGVVWLLFERLDGADALLWRSRAEAVAKGALLWRTLESGDGASSWTLEAAGPHGEPPSPRLAHDGEAWRFEECLSRAAFPVLIFGGGHVGTALVDTLLPVGAQITWVDTRDAQMPERAGVSKVITDTPESEVDDAPPGSYFLILTHSHALDLELVARVFRRSDYAYFGLIGSRTKRKLFEPRLAARGVPAERLAELTCPIGIPGIRGKEPAVIAIAVVAQLLQIREARGVLQRAAKPAALAGPVDGRSRRPAAPGRE